MIPQQKTAAKELNLFDFDDDDNAGTAVQAAAPASKASIDGGSELFMEENPADLGSIAPRFVRRL